MVSILKAGLSAWFPIFAIQTLTFILVITIALAIGAISAIFPVQKAMRMRIVDGLRTVD
jgi:ABC-type antimicrobial peptide transport system permease subunit